MEFRPVQSSHIEAVGHDPDSGTMAVRFKNGAVYHYPDTGADEFEALLGAPSVGRALQVHRARGKRIL